MFEQTRLHGLPVVNGNGRLAGLITLSDIRGLDSAGLRKTVGEVATHQLAIAFPDESLNDALRKMGLRGVAHLPVMDREDHTHLLGWVTTQDIVAQYNRYLTRRHTRLHTTQDEDIFE